MKSIKLLVLSALALAFRPPPAFTTANAAPDPTADLQKAQGEMQAQLDQLAADNAALKKQLSDTQTQLGQAQATKAAPPSTELELLAKGAGMDPVKDLQWRIAAGLSPLQAVEAVRQQRNLDKVRTAAADREAKQKAAAAKAGKS